MKQRFTIHGYRHTLHNLVRQAASGVVARAITGHMTAAMTEHYSEITVAEKRAALASALGSVSFL